MAIVDIHAKNPRRLSEISLARRSPPTSRSDSVLRGCSAFVTPGRTPLSISAIASRTMRTARSRILGDSDAASR